MQNFDEIGGFLRIDPETILIILSSRVSWRFTVSHMLSTLLGMEEEDKAFLS
jgi:hypothetical protein